MHCANLLRRAPAFDQNRSDACFVGDRAEHAALSGPEPQLAYFHALIWTKTNQLRRGAGDAPHLWVRPPCTALLPTPPLRQCFYSNNVISAATASTGITFYHDDMTYSFCNIICSIWRHETSFLLFLFFLYLFHFPEVYIPKSSYSLHLHIGSCAFNSPTLLFSDKINENITF